MANLVIFSCLSYVICQKYLHIFEF